MTKLLLIRHGQSANNALPEVQRVADPGLTELGILQAQATARCLQQFEITHVYCSPFLRALETARPIAELKQLAVHIRCDIFEQGGCYSGYLEVGRRGEPGMGLSELRRKYPGWHVDPAIGETGWWGRDYEDWEQARIRAERVAAWILEELVPLGGMHVLVIHADFKSLLVAAILASSRKPFQIMEPLHNTGISEFCWSDTSWELQRFNCVAHLAAELVTF